MELSDYDYPYTIDLSGYITVDEGSNLDSGSDGQHYKILAIDGSKISLCDGELYSEVESCTTATEYFFTNQADAQAYMNTLP
ncbi:MAG: hypothetical protein IBX43_05985 [Campylobacterales bacterium]|nr:hypothetical protein [Campylobacterales bacterium]